MPLTRDEAFPAEAAQLMAMLNHCCEGHHLLHVEMAVTNMFAAVINSGSVARQLKGHKREMYLAQMIARAAVIARDNFNRKPEATDIPVGEN